MRGISFVVAMVVPLVVAPACWAEVLVPMIQFGAEADFDDNFTVISGGQYDPTDDAGYGVGGFVATSKTGHNSMVYDVDKASGGVGEVFGQATIDLDFKVNVDGGGGVGIWAFDEYTGTITRHYKTWTFFQAFASGNDDQVSYYTARNMNDSGGILRETDTADTTLAPYSWLHLRVDIDNSAGSSADITVSVYDSQTLFDATTLKFQESYTHLNGALGTGEIGVSLYYAQFDNFAVYSLGDGPTVIPEPGTMALLATGLLGLLCYAWRKRK